MPKLLVKLSIAVLFSAWLVTPVFSQQACGLTSSPSLLNLHLGMTPAEVASVFGSDLKIKIKAAGHRVFFQNYIAKPAQGKLSGVRALYLRFLDGKLYQIEIFFEDRAGWDSLETTAGGFAGQMGIANDLWTFKQGHARIDCGSFTVLADKVLNPRIEITDEQSRERIKSETKKK